VHAQDRGSGSSGDGAICGLFLEDQAHLAQHAVTKRFADRQVTIGEVCLEPVSERLLRPELLRICILRRHGRRLAKAP
jgi:hypothetical protein